MPLHRKAALKRKTPVAEQKVALKRTVKLPPGGPLPFQSAKRRALMVARRSFVVDFLRAHPRCMVRWDGGCTGWAVHVHEALTRGRGGVIVPTPGRFQKFVGTCWWCHAMIHDHPAEATARGWLLDGHGRGAAVALVVVDDEPPTPVEATAGLDTQQRIVDFGRKYGL